MGESHKRGGVDLSQALNLFSDPSLGEHPMLDGSKLKGALRDKHRSPCLITMSKDHSEGEPS